MQKVTVRIINASIEGTLFSKYNLASTIPTAKHEKYVVVNVYDLKPKTL
jgi:hypothetical protein